MLQVNSNFVSYRGVSLCDVDHIMRFSLTLKLAIIAVHFQKI